MPRGRPRTSSGCVTCKTRRKKCDEQRERCGACQRLGLICTWPDDQDIADLSLSSDQTTTTSSLGLSDEETSLPVRRIPRRQLVNSNKAPDPKQHPAIPSSVNGGGYVPFGDETQLDLVMQSPRYLALLISRSASQEFHDTSILVKVALQHEWLRDTFATFSAFNKAAVGRPLREASGDITAMTHYNSALTRLRRHISAVRTDWMSIPVLTGITFLGIYESLGTGNGRLAIAHFATAAIVSQAIPVPDAIVDLVLYRIAIECWLFNLSSLTIYHPLKDSVVHSIDWTILDRAFNGGTNGSNRLFLSGSPFIGGSHAIYRLMMQVSWFARQPCSQQYRQRFCERWDRELAEIMDGLGTYYTALPVDVADLYYWKHVLHIYALRIYLAKIANHRVASLDIPVVSVVEDACAVLKRRTTHEARNPSMAWPLVVFLCASHRSPRHDFFIETIATIKDNFDPGHRCRLSAVLESLKEENLTRLCHCEGECEKTHDTLDLLLSPHGILGPQPEG